MSKNKVFKPSGDWIKKSHVDSLEKYETIYHDSVSNPDEFWGTIADRIKWYKKCCLLYTSPSPRDKRQSRMPSSA